MAVRICKGLFIIGLMILVTGCWNRRELNEMSIAVAMGLDEAREGRVLVSVQVVNPGEIASKKTSGSGGTPVTTFRAEGNSIFEALRKLTLKLNRKIYLSHLRMLVIGEELARKGIAEPIDYLSRDHELRTDFAIVIAKNGKAEAMLDILTPQEKIPASKLYSSLEVGEKAWASTSKVSLDMLINDLENDGKNPALTGIIMKGPHNEGQKLSNLQLTDTKTIMVYDGFAVFRKDKLVGWLNINDSQGYNYIQGKVKSTIIVNSCSGGVIEVELIRTKTAVKATLTEKGEPKIIVDVHGEGNVGDVSCDINMLDPTTIPRIERMTEQRIVEIIKGVVDTTQSKYKTDILGFGDTVHRAYPQQWKKWKQDWDSTFMHLTVQVDVHIDIRRIGTINQPIKSKVRK
ncbi:Ger(x)C family spore germination protein [Paenibacillus sp. FJAT-27812]|uniref:Ger(x)C family spore germination protein n=1 Tax=Paenibacillus sp. FJAT-27812 TaxID=1684143 RepID=UPI0006A783F0|nr:Ger(x)C family spore germination protein [Paenibacillus sp. FJAT-27812]